ncbi:MAG: hypothetical protein GY941_18375, partial [Planctomycetes bacterium]|nr:hypothetical protein [Planctomycetota bacterium]
MDIKKIIITGFEIISTWPKKKLLKAIQILRDTYQDIERQNKELREENARLKEELKKQKIHETNKAANCPSSKQPEWEAKGVGNDGKGKNRRRGKKARKGAGNKRKDVKPNSTSKAQVEACDVCGKDLSKEEPLESVNERIIEDIPEATRETNIILVKQEKKYCDKCKRVVTAKSELALPGSDIG